MVGSFDAQVMENAVSQVLNGESTIRGVCRLYPELKVKTVARYTRICSCQLLVLFLQHNLYVFMLPWSKYANSVNLFAFTQVRSEEERKPRH